MQHLLAAFPSSNQTMGSGGVGLGNLFYTSSPLTTRVWIGNQIASCLEKLVTSWSQSNPASSPRALPSPVLPVRPELAVILHRSEEGGSGKQTASCWEVGCLAMLWALWPRGLASKGLPLLGVVLLRKREKRGPQWSHCRVKYLLFPGKCGLEGSWECSPL